MKILILVLSYTQPPYDALMEAQQKTWDSINVPGVTTLYYSGKVMGTQGYSWQYCYNANCSDDYFLMHHKFAECLRAIDISKYDLVFRTNSSSYVNKAKLLEFATTLPKEKCYAGWSLGEKEAVSGAGIFLSPDVIQILRDEIPAGENIEEDILIGRILHGKHGIKIVDDKSRFDVTDENIAEVPKDRYHYRFKTSDRTQDVENMRKVHKLLTK